MVKVCGWEGTEMVLGMLNLIYAEYERRWNVYASAVGIAEGETDRIWGEILCVLTLREHTHEPPTMMNSCSKQITTPFVCGC